MKKRETRTGATRNHRTIAHAPIFTYLTQPAHSNYGKRKETMTEEEGGKLGTAVKRENKRTIKEEERQEKDNKERCNSYKEIMQEKGRKTEKEKRQKLVNIFISHERRQKNIIREIGKE